MGTLIDFEALEMFDYQNVIIIAIIIIIIKGFALWKAARLKETVWFWVLMIISSLGILPAVYLFLRRNRKV